MNNVQKYSTLNSVVPYFNKTKYPYSTITPDKIIETQREIELVYRHNDKFFVESSGKDNKGRRDLPKKGGSLCKITVYTM